MVADPEVTIQVGAEVFTARARTVVGDERRALWALVTAVFPRYDTYQAQTERELPLVVIG